MPRIIQPVVSPRGRVIVLTGATLWLFAAMVLSATPDGVGASTGDVVYTMTMVTNPVHSLEELDGAPGILYYPRVTADARGRAYVADEGQHHVVRLASDLRTAEVVFGREGAGPGELQMPHSVAVDSQGNVFVADLQLDRITKFAADGTFVRSIAAPGAASLLMDSQDRLIAYPAAGTALLQRYDSDLEEIDTLLEKTDPKRHRSSLGVLIAMGPQDRLYVLDQTGPTLSAYDREMNQIGEWEVNPPLLRESIDAHLEAMRKRMPEGFEARWNGIQSMAIHPDGQTLAFFYLVKESPDVKYTQVAWYHVDGTHLSVEKRSGKVLSGALLPGGRMLEGDAEEVRIRELQTTPTTSGNNN
jgi:streptogramin lyase